MLNPDRVSLRCQNGHQYIYELTESSEVECQHNSCNLKINSSRVLRGDHPYIIWVSQDFETVTNSVKTITVIPLTSQTTFLGLPTTYPINPTSKNNLKKKSYVLVHQIITIDINCLKKANGDWLERIGQLGKDDKEATEKRLKFYLNLSNKPDDDWFKQNASPELLVKIFDYLPDEDKEKSISTLLDKIS